MWLWLRLGRMACFRDDESYKKQENKQKLLPQIPRLHACTHARTHDTKPNQASAPSHARTHSYPPTALLLCTWKPDDAATQPPTCPHQPTNGFAATMLMLMLAPPGARCVLSTSMNLAGERGPFLLLNARLWPLSSPGVDSNCRRRCACQHAAPATLPVVPLLCAFSLFSLA